MWKTFSLATQGKDPLGTVTSLDLREAEGTKALVSTMAPPPVSISDLPSVPLRGSSGSANDPVTTDFEVVGVLGEGGMGRVLLARQRSLQRDVALKVLKADESRRDIVDTLLTEAVITGSIEHPNIVPVHALGRDKNGLPVLVMKRIDGVSWRKLYEQPEHPLWKSMGIETTDKFETHLEILMSVCNAVHYAHSRGIIHRDIKLDNVMMGGFGEVYLVDWGIALYSTNTHDLQGPSEDFSPPVGTLAYMAPEMAMGDICRIDARTDVYLLGATLHFLLTGQGRHQGETPLDLLLSARDSEPFDYGPSVPTELAAIANRALHVDPEKRFSSALELRQALAQFRRHRGSLTLSAKAFGELAAMDDAQEIPERQLRRRMTESRFAFMQALEIWPGNQAAREGLDKVLGRMIEYEITQRDLEGAQALLAELSITRPDLEAKIDALRADFTREQAESLRLQTIAKNTDLRVDAQIQAKLVAILPICAFASIFLLYANGENSALIERQLIVFPLALILLLTTIFAVLRKRFTTTIARRSFGLLLLYPLSMLVHRICGKVQDEPLPITITTDLVFSSILSIAFALTILPRMGWVSLVFVAAAACVLKFPEQAMVIFVVASTLSTVFLSWVWVSMAREERPRGAS
jgi:eukaryotic-like serine/threonine-protein kinase